MVAANSLLPFEYSLQTVISTVNRSRTDATNVLIHDMEAIMTAYSASDTRILNIKGGSVYDNAPANLWVGVEVDGFSTGTIDMTTFVNNENIEYVFLASSNATITIRDTNVTDAIGGLNLVSILAIRSKLPRVHIISSHIVLRSLATWG
jgi:hypothetical protein